MRIPNKTRHIRWNFEPSPDTLETGRYHFVVVDDKDREGIMERILEQVRNYGGIEHIRTIEGKVTDSRYRFLYQSWDANVDPNKIDWEKIGKPVKRDRDLRERQNSQGIEDYLVRTYGNVDKS